jgi:signal transduction histidine kinase/CheY-like chemotaxis protein
MFWVKKTLLFCGLVFGLFFLSKAQKPLTVQQMKAEVENIRTPDTTRLRIMISLIDSIYDATVWEPLNERAFQLAEKLSKFHDARTSYLGKLFLADAINNKGFADLSRGNINKTLDYYFESLKLREEINYEVGIASSYNNLSYIFSEQGDTTQALKYLEQSISIRRKFNDKHGIAQSLNNIGQIYLAKEDKLKAIEYFKQSIALFEEDGSLNSKSKAMYNLGEVYFLQKRYVEARSIINESLNNLQNLHDDENVAWAVLKIGAIELEEGNVFEAEEKCKQAIIVSQANQFAKVESASYLLLSRIFEKKKNFSRALEFFKKHIVINNKINNQSIQKHTAQYQVAYEYAQRDAKLQLEKNQKEQEARLLLYFYIALALLFFLLSSILYYSNRIRTKANASLAEKNKQVELALSRAEESERFKSQFLSNVSHEIRTPMNAIFGMSALLSESSLNEQQKGYLHAIKNSSENLLLIINDVLDFSKLEAGKLLLEDTPFSLVKVLEDVYNTLRFKSEEKGLKFTLQNDVKIAPYLMGDGFRLYQILLNLSSNAIKFTDSGTVSIQVELIENQELTDKQCLRFLVKDTGIGIPPQKLKSIFESFQQADLDTTRKFGGTGLGLSIAQQLAALRGSEIQVESEVGKGSVFYFVMDFQTSDQAAYNIANGEPKVEDVQKLKNLSILLAEDNEYNRIVAVDSLKKALRHVTIMEVETGSQVLDALVEFDFDLILMDINMPEMNGFEATTHIRKGFPIPKKNIPIIALTAFSNKEEEDQCYAVGMNGHITKPFKINDLIGSINKVINTNTPLQTLEKNSQNSDNNKNEEIDLSFLRDFTEGDVTEMNYFIEKFIRTIPNSIDNLSQAIVREDLVAIKKITHTIKPQIEFIGIKKVLANLIQIEEYAKEPTNIQQITTIFEDTEEKIKQAIIFLETLKK